MFNNLQVKLNRVQYLIVPGGNSKSGGISAYTVDFLIATACWRVDPEDATDPFL